MSRREYRVVQLTHGDGSFSFEVEYRTNTHSPWLLACGRQTLDLAKAAIEVMKRCDVVNRDVLYVD